MSLPNDVYNRTVVLVTANGSDTYTATDGSNNAVSVGFPSGANSQTQAYNALSAMAPPGYTPPAQLLSQSLTPVQFGNYVIQQILANAISRGLTSAQRLTLFNGILKYGQMLMAGDIVGFQSQISTIPVDGTIVTSGMITVITAAVNGYLAGTL